MKINKIIINDFGKLSNKQIEFGDNINIIKGKNESGKSTIQKFIVSMFYGLSKDKRKSSFTDYDKYYPWGKTEFSGKINYTLDNEQTFEVFRDFTKKMPIIYNENAEDITKKYGSTKASGSSFFEEQTGVDEKTMISSIVTEQTNVVIDQSSENYMIQRIANLAQTGDEKVSYDKAQAYLTKKRNEEVGTEKTKNRPINILNEEKRKVISEKQELDEYTKEQYQLDENIKNAMEEHKKNKRLLDFAMDYKTIMDGETQLKNKISVYNENLERNNIEQRELEKQKDSLIIDLEKNETEYGEVCKNEEIEDNDRVMQINQQKKKRKKINVICGIICSIVFIASIVAFILKLMLLGGALVTIMLLSALIAINSNRKLKTKIYNYENCETSKKSELYKQEIEKISSKIREVEVKNNILTKNNNEIEEQINEIHNALKNNEKLQISDLLNKYSDIPEEDYSEILGSKKISTQIQTLQNLSNNSNLNLQKYEYRKNYIMPRIEKIADLQENLYEIEEREKELLKQANSLSIASEVLEEAYEEMKENVVPKFTENLSNTISEISNGKYSRLLTNDKEGLLVEKENGEYIPAKALSIGTIDQLYLSLRFAISKEATDQKMPLILDEAFPYYDNERLANILCYIAKEFAKNQVIIFTCTDREIKELEKQKIMYNLIEI